MESSDIRRERSRGSRYVIFSGDSKQFCLTPPLHYTHSMKSGDSLFELLPSNKLKLIYKQP